MLYSYGEEGYGDGGQTEWRLAQVKNEQLRRQITYFVVLARSLYLDRHGHRHRHRYRNRTEYLS